MRRFLLGLCLSVGLAQAEVMEIRAEPGADEKLVAAVTKAMESYNRMLKEELGLELQKSVRIDICPTEEIYRNKLYDFGLRGAEGEKVARSTGGIANSSQRRILVKLGSASQLKRANMLVAHEMTHFLTSELSDGSARANSWMNEGMAEFVAALVAQKMGSQSFEKWKLEVVNNLRLADSYPMPQDLVDISGKNYDKWRDLTDKFRGKNYSMANLMMVYLYEQKGRKFFGELFEYQRCLSSTFTSENTCFTKNFGVEQEQFYPQVQAWVKVTLGQAGGLEVVDNGQTAVATEVGQNYVVAQVLLEEKLGRKLGVTIRMILSKNQEEMVSQLAEELGLSAEDAAKRSKISGWLWQDSLLFLDTNRTNTLEKRADMLGQLAMGRYLQLRAGSMNHVYWLYAGLKDWMSAQLLEKLGMQTPEQRLALRQNILGNAKKGVPALAELTSLADWNKAVNKYGSMVVRQVAAEAAYALLAKKDGPVLGQWIELNKQLKGSPEAFLQVFGEPVDTFTRQFRIVVALNER